MNMFTPIIPPDEELRLADLYAYGILDSGKEKEFDDLVELAASISKCGIVAISFIDKDRQWFKSIRGLSKSETSRTESFCGHTILQDDVMIVEDTLKDDRFYDNPLVTGFPKIRFYAGAPIISKSGYKLGTVCVCDAQPHVLSEEQARMLTIIAQQVTRLLELHLKNKIILEKAESLLRQGKQLLLHTLSDQEKEKQFIGTELHENIAQILSASLFNLDMALSCKDISMIPKVSEQLTTLLKEVQKLSKTITPTTLEKTPLDSMIGDYIKERSPEFPFPILYSVRGNFERLNPEHTMAFFRIAEVWIESKSGYEYMESIHMHLEGGKMVEMTLECIEPKVSEMSPDKGLKLKAFSEQIKSFGGRVIAGDHFIKVSLDPNFKKIEVSKAMTEITA